MLLLKVWELVHIWDTTNCYKLFNGNIENVSELSIILKSLISPRRRLIKKNVTLDKNK